MERYDNQRRGRIRQTPIYVGKFFRMFIYLNDWRVLPMSALIAALVVYVAGANIFKTMEGMALGSMALTCICLWNGCFNSIQVVCRERGIVKREHRAGMHVFSYISAHMIYQAFLCLMQSVITVIVCRVGGMALPVEGIVTPWFYLDFVITLFLVTYAADMMSLMISCIVHNTTSAMTVMPLVLIFELVFSGIMFNLGGKAETLGKLTIAKWGMIAICALGKYNDLPMVSVWNQIFKFRKYEVGGLTPINDLVKYIESNDLTDDFCLEVGRNSPNLSYVSTVSNVTKCWLVLILFVAVFAILSMVFLKFIDRDKR